MRLPKRDPRRQIGTLIQTLRRVTLNANGRPLSQTELGHTCGWGVRRQSRLERGTAKIRPSELAALCDALPGLAALVHRAADPTPARVLVGPGASAGRPPLVTPNSALDELPAMLKVADCRTYLNCGRDEVYRLIRTGQLRSIRIGRLLRVERSELQRFLEAARSGPSVVGDRRMRVR